LWQKRRPQWWWLTITTSLPGFSATSLLADQQNKHSDSYQQGKQSTDGKPRAGFTVLF